MTKGWGESCDHEASPGHLLTERREGCTLRRMRKHLSFVPAALLCASVALAAPRPAPAAEAAAEKLAVPFVANDYARVLADARQRRVPLFIDNWAMW